MVSSRIAAAFTLTSVAAHPRNAVHAALSGSRIDSSSPSRSGEGGSCSIERQAFLEMADGFLERHSTHRQLARFAPPADRRGQIARLRVVMGQQLGLVGDAIGEVLLEHLWRSAHAAAAACS